MINELNIQTSSQCISEELLRKKLFVLYSYSILSSNIHIVKIFCVLHNKVALLTRDVLSGEQEIVISIFHKYFLVEWEQVYQFSLKSKTTEGNSDAIYFFKFYINQSSNQLFLFLHFPGLWNLNSFMWRVVSMSFLTLKVLSVYYLLQFNHFKFMSYYLYVPNNLKDIKDHI